MNIILTSDLPSSNCGVGENVSLYCHLQIYLIVAITQIEQFYTTSNNLGVGVPVDEICTTVNSTRALLRKNG